MGSLACQKLFRHHGRIWISILDYNGIQNALRYDQNDHHFCSGALKP